MVTTPTTGPLPGSLLRVPHPRPSRLSDPGRDFWPGHLEALLQTPDAELTFGHFNQLLGPHLPAGTYEEVVYFLPLALDYLLTREDAVQVVTPVVGFVSEHADDLRRDGLFDGAADALRRSLARWTSTFRVRHYDRDACRANGSGLPYLDIVEYTETVALLTEELVEFEALADLAVEFVRGLARPDAGPEEGEAAAAAADVRAAWFLEYARWCGSLLGPPEFPPITALVTDRGLLRRAARRVREAGAAPGASSPTYWPDTFRHLGV